jgi:hypothetical protein
MKDVRKRNAVIASQILVIAAIIVIGIIRPFNGTTPKSMQSENSGTPSPTLLNTSEVTPAPQSTTNPSVTPTPTPASTPEPTPKPSVKNTSTPKPTSKAVKQTQPAKPAPSEKQGSAMSEDFTYALKMKNLIEELQKKYSVLEVEAVSPNYENPKEWESRIINAAEAMSPIILKMKGLKPTERFQTIHAGLMEAAASLELGIKTVEKGDVGSALAAGIYRIENTMENDVSKLEDDLDSEVRKLGAQ